MENNGIEEIPHPPALPDLSATRPDSCPFDPDETYTRLRAQAPLSMVRRPAGMDAWLVSRYDDIREVLADPCLGSRVAGDAHVLPYYDPQDPVPDWMIQLDGEEHARLRRLLIGEFMLAGSGADLVRDLASPIPTRVTCEMLGIPTTTTRRSSTAARR
ncbi:MULTISPECIES: hypothetical protein [unclassified Streptomyces]|uniref:hypothetical protein n=1 Tax=unclassified Streptomyces TaxID=2593676 RepID=UPI00110FB2C4|nr:hypothetical protein [Streptomyces sp. DASNCL29]TMU98185.1 hypothetical protein FGK60_10250 [Streptomyces sp. DASNCL29]